MTGHHTPEASLVATPSPQDLFKLLDTVASFDGGVIPENGTHKFFTSEYLDTVGDIEFGERSVISSIAAHYGRIGTRAGSYRNAAWRLRLTERYRIGSRLTQSTHNEFVWSDGVTSRSVRKIRVSNDYSNNDLYVQLDRVDNLDKEHLVLATEQQMMQVSAADCEELMQRMSMLQTKLLHESLPTSHRGRNK